MSSQTIPEATGASIRPRNLIKHKRFLITDFGAREDAAPALNTKAINSAIQTAAMEGGTVVIPEGTFHIYTILLKSNVNLYLSEGAVLRPQGRTSSILMRNSPARAAITRSLR